MASNEDFTEITCPMPAVRLRYDEDIDSHTRRVDTCGAELYVVSRDYSQLLAGGPMQINSWWRVECQLGHVLLVPDGEGTDRDIPFSFDDFSSALTYIADLLYPRMTISGIGAVMDETVVDL